MSKRSFVDEAAVVATGVQTLQDRFGKRQRRGDYDDSVPAVSPWRCNLTGLSQTENLYFVAYADKIHVYVPQYSTQALPQDPAFIVTSEPSTYGLPGYLDRRNPHSINNLVISNLGTEEVVAVVRDDGDVDAFLVRHIVQAIRTNQEVIAEGSVSSRWAINSVRPFFQSNVGKSAWGLAIHSQARVIAVSANTHNITIFKFGLVENGEEGEAPSRPSRREDVTQQVLNGTSNIPHIAFCNTDDDPEGRWLLTTDITGYCRSIDLFEMRTAQTFRFGRPISYSTASEHDPINSGWFVGFLDRRSFVQQESVYAALGMAETDGMDGTPSIWDIGQTIAHIPDNSSKFSVVRNRPRPSRSPPPSRSTSGVQSPTSEPVTSDQDQEAPVLNIAQITEQMAEDEIPAPPQPEMSDESSDSEDDDSEGSLYWTDGMEIDGEGTEDDPSYTSMYGGRRTYGNAPRAYQPYNAVCDLPCPILHASVRNVYLLQPSKQETDSPFTLPTVGFANALHQLVQGQLSGLNIFERLNMHAYIPSIGVVVFASQKGRAMVLSLTKLVNKTARYPSNWQKPTIPAAKVTYAMRFERILPFASQEEAGQRPFAPLAGIATGPMQGTEHLPDERKRWRLLMYYADHTVFSYEISRRRARESVVDIQGVVV